MIRKEDEKQRRWKAKFKQAEIYVYGLICNDYDYLDMRIYIKFVLIPHVCILNRIWCKGLSYENKTNLEQIYIHKLSYVYFNSTFWIIL